MNEIQQLSINNGDILVSYDVSSLFTNVPLDETIQLLITDMAFTNNWFNETYEIHLSRQDLVDLLKAATKGQLVGFSMVADPDLQIRGGGHPDPEIRSRWGGWSQKNIFGTSHFGSHFGLSIRGPPGASPGSATADGVAMGSPLGPLLANVFMCSIEDRLEQEGKMPTYYRRFVGDTPTVMRNKTSWENLS